MPFIGKGAIAADHEKRGGFWDSRHPRRHALPCDQPRRLGRTADRAGAPIPQHQHRLRRRQHAAGEPARPPGLRDPAEPSSRPASSPRPRSPSRATSTATPSRARIDRLDAILAEHPEFGPGTFTANEDGSVALYSVPVNGDTTAERDARLGARAARRLRPGRVRRRGRRGAGRRRERRRASTTSTRRTTTRRSSSASCCCSASSC